MSTPQDPFASPEPSRPDLTKRPHQRQSGFALPGSSEQETPAQWPAHGEAPSAYAQPPAYGQPPAAYGQPPAYGPPAGYGAPAGYGQPPAGYGAPTGYGQPPAGYGAPAGYGQPYPYGPGPVQDDPRQALSTAASRLSLAAWFLWATFLGWAVFAIAGLVYLDGGSKWDAGRSGAAIDAADNAEATYGLGFLALVLTGGAVWALLALWTSWTARAARAAGRAPQVTLSHLGWWGLFVPLGGLVLPVLAYAQAARATDSARNGGNGRLPALLIVWWVLAAIAYVLSFAGMTTTGDDVTYPYWNTAGTLFLLGGITGVASCVVGAISFRRIARQAREAISR